MIDPKMFDLNKLLAAMLDDVHGNVNPWRAAVEILPGYVRHGQRMGCAVRFGEGMVTFGGGGVWLRHGAIWDMYPDDFGTPERALVAMLLAPPPPAVLRWELFEDAMTEQRKLLRGEDT